MSSNSWSTRVAGWARKVPFGIVLLVAFGLGMLFRSGLRPVEPAELASDEVAHGAPGTDPGSTEEVYWTCSMHPQIRRSGPGPCPLCGMDLVEARVDVGAGLRGVQMSSAARALLDVRTAPVERRFVSSDVRMVGKLDYDETSLGDITAWVPGRLDRLYVDYTGVRVEQGEHMVYLYSPEILAAQEELLQALRGAPELAATDIDALRDAGQRTLDSARERLRLWGLTSEQIREIEERGTPSDHITIYAPMGGIVIEKHAQQGMYVQTGTRIYTIADLSHLWLRLDAYESDLPWLRYGQEVEFTVDAGPGETFRGTITFIDPVLDPRTRTVKVRVNVPNHDGRLKPQMFARAVVRARVAAGGRVMDPGMAGKWVCPMHPEIVREEAGPCDVCEMDLRPAESLGFVAASEESHAPPLVVPASAVLRTGQRAVVYVEVPDQDAPTFEGREILLGPRAGDYYLVRSGLREGEQVVSHGNFALDSALQIEAKPSMMTPLGGGGAGAHDHGGGERTEEAAAATELPAAARFQVEEVERACAAVGRALAGEDLAGARGAFARLGQLLATVPTEPFPAPARAAWSEAAMRLANDAVEGEGAGDLADAHRVFEGTTATLHWMRGRLGTTPPAAAPRERDRLPAELAERLTGLWESYGELHAALSTGDATAARATTARLAELAAPEAWSEHAPELARVARRLPGAFELEELQVAFEELSDELDRTLQDYPDPLVEPAYRVHCPMAFDGGGAAWLQTGREVSNPYFGGGMPRCGSVVGVIEGSVDGR